LNAPATAERLLDALESVSGSAMQQRAVNKDEAQAIAAATADRELTPLGSGLDNG
jgi:hypothetical protein